MSYGRMLKTFIDSTESAAVRNPSFSSHVGSLENLSPRFASVSLISSMSFLTSGTNSISPSGTMTTPKSKPSDARAMTLSAM